MDSPPPGGPYYGIYRELAAQEALQANDAAGFHTRHPVELVAWTNDVGSRGRADWLTHHAHAARSTGRILERFLRAP